MLNLMIAQRKMGGGGGGGGWGGVGGGGGSLHYAKPFYNLLCKTIYYARINN